MWIWENKNWYRFTYDRSVLAEAEKTWLKKSGEGIGAFKCVSDGDREALKIELIADEATKTSEIEGQILNRNSVQSSLRKQMGLSCDQRNIPPAEHGIASMMTDLYGSFDDPLDDETLFRWHKHLMNGRTDQIVACRSISHILTVAVKFIQELGNRILASYGLAAFITVGLDCKVIKTACIIIFKY